MRTKILIAFIFLLIGKFTYSQENGSLLDKRISLEIKDQKIEHILKSIEEIGGFKIGYSGNSIDPSKTVSIHLKDRPIKEFLNAIFPSEKFQYKEMNNRVLVFKKKSNSNKKYTISGYIKESGSEEHLLGVSIYVPELKIGTTSNGYGFYSLTIPEGDHEIFISYIGYDMVVKQLDLIIDTVLTIEMTVATQNLDEVVVTADQKLKESAITQMSTIRLNPTDIQNMPTLLGEKDVLKTLQLLPGIQSGTEGTSGFFIRGGTHDQNLIILDDATVYNVSHVLGVFSIFNRPFK